MLRTVAPFNPANIPGCVLYLPLWKSYLQGSSFYSLDQYRHLCTVTGATWGSQGYSFDGIDDGIAVVHHANQLLTTGGSIGEWVYPTGNGESAPCIVDKSTNVSGAGGFKINKGLDADDRFVGRINGGTQIVSTGTLTRNSWNHLVVTWSNTGLITLYLNGAQDSTTPAISADPAGITTANALTIGNRSGATDRTFDGGIGEVQIYNRVLSVGESSNIYSATCWRYK